MPLSSCIDVIEPLLHPNVIRVTSSGDIAVGIEDTLEAYRVRAEKKDYDKMTQHNVSAAIAEILNPFAVSVQVKTILKNIIVKNEKGEEGKGNRPLFVHMLYVWKEGLWLLKTIIASETSLEEVKKGFITL